jgi:hypothetical protein
MYADIIFQPADDTAQARFWLAHGACRCRNTPVAGNCDKGGKMINVPFHERYVSKIGICADYGMRYHNFCQGF